MKDCDLLAAVVKGFNQADLARAVYWYVMLRGRAIVVCCHHDRKDNDVEAGDYSRYEITEGLTTKQWNKLETKLGLWNKRGLIE